MCHDEVHCTQNHRNVKPVFVSLRHFLSGSDISCSEIPWWTSWLPKVFSSMKWKLISFHQTRLVSNYQWSRCCAFLLGIKERDAYTMLQEGYQYKQDVDTPLCCCPEGKLLECAATSYRPSKYQKWKAQPRKVQVWLSSPVYYGNGTHTAAPGTCCLPDPLASVSSAHWV